MKATLMAILCSAAILASGCATSHSRDTAWDYKVVEGYVASDIEKTLNHLGGDGWVVVSSSNASDANHPVHVLVILKRHK